MVLPLIDKVIIRETNTLDLKSYQDTDGDGVADKIEMWHDGGDRGGNLEHQPSGLIWNIENWLYTTYSRHRYRLACGSPSNSPNRSKSCHSSWTRRYPLKTIHAAPNKNFRGNS
ncbi:MAG: hypothetical protein WBD20_26915 [Pirellulaceae bacterium]